MTKKHNKRWSLHDLGYWTGLVLIALPVLAVLYRAEVLSVLFAIVIIATLTILYLVDMIHLLKSDAAASQANHLVLEGRFQLALDQLVAANLCNQQLKSQLISAKQHQRSQIAYDLHDGLTQTAVATHQLLQCFAAEYRPYYTDAMPPKYIPDLSLILSLAKQTIIDSRVLIDDLRPRILDEYGLHAAIQQKVTDFQQRGFTVSLTVLDHCEYTPIGGVPSYTQRITREAETALYAVCLEALNNAAKHSSAENIDVCLEMLHISGDEPQSSLTVRDNGVGFDSEAYEKPHLYISSPGERVGLLSMQERIKVLGGDITVSSTPGEGTIVSADIPYRVVEPHYEPEPSSK